MGGGCSRAGEVNGVDHIGFISLLHRQVSEELDV